MRRLSRKGQAGSALRRKLANPDIAIVNRVIVVLQLQGKLLGSGLVWRSDMMAGRTGQLNVILYQNSVVQDSHSRGPDQIAVLGEARPMKNDVISLPLSGRPGSVYQWRILTVDPGRLAISISLVDE